MSNIYINWNSKLYDACREGHKDLVLSMIEKEEHKDLVLSMIEKGTYDLNRGLNGACIGGHKDLALLMIEKGAYNWNHGLWYACYGGHINTALLMIEKGADDWNRGLAGACYGGHKDLVLFMFEKGADINYLDRMHPLITNDDILYLIQRGVRHFGKYDKKEKICRMWLLAARIELNSILIPDLANIVASY